MDYFRIILHHAEKLKQTYRIKPQKTNSDSLASSNFLNDVKVHKLRFGCATAVCGHQLRLLEIDLY